MSAVGSTTIGVEDWANGSVYVYGSCSDSQSGCKNSQSDNPGNVSSEGTSYYSPGKVYDNAGNQTTCSSKTVKIDTKPPTCDITMPNPASTGWYNLNTGSPTATLTKSDASSGVYKYGLAKGLEGELKDDPIYNSNTSVSFGEGKNQKVKSWVMDKAGNKCTDYKINIHVDLTRPRIDNCWAFESTDSSSTKYGWACQSEFAGYHHMYHMVVPHIQDTLSGIEPGKDITFSISNIDSNYSGKRSTGTNNRYFCVATKSDPFGKTVSVSNLKDRAGNVANNSNSCDDSNDSGFNSNCNVASCAYTSKSSFSSSHKCTSCKYLSGPDDTFSCPSGTAKGGTCIDKPKS